MGREALAEAMIPVIGRLYRENNVVTSIHGRSLINKSTMNILKAHRFARRMSNTELQLEETAPLLNALAELELGAAAIDIARLTEKYRAEGEGASLDAFLRTELADIVGKRGADNRTSTDVVLYGFGRIGRLLARILIEKAGGGHGLRLRAIVVRKGADNDLVKRASLLRRDSVHGSFEGTIRVDEEANTITANGVQIQVIYSDNPATVDYTAYGIKDALVVDNTGRWRDAEGLSQHLQSKGVARVLLTAPGKGNLKNIVHGINQGDITDEDKIVTAASCTTNAITPVLKAINDKFGIVHGHVETVHSFTNDQNLIDNFHKGDRRGRSAALNMVITETGAAKAVAKALPELQGKLTGNAIRVPTPDVSMAILNLNLSTSTTRDEVNDYLREMSLHSQLRKQIDYIDSPDVVSTDFVGSRRAGIVDGLATISTDKNLVLYVWYDNEFGYSCQVVRVMEEIAGVNPPSFPARDVVAPIAVLEAANA
ncbi:glyceraldehyde-3-phosphate dehydrogenase [Paenarthrobacter sp. R1]|uniref:Glyceraldehyde-3-phosphate dehydrogenase n=2 Tax=Micrococcaceae TaxID=1268 RepID=A0AAX3EP78_PAEUR|nr:MULTISPECIES: glyceraldehyde-3-phosphate dehydrogenase [Paenarthrobacter]MDO5864946.1 glyceraldehyde-3-phosphate dehydrogenase [Paenarthrobacter sp. SD-2]MDO5876022.1 glyceraldehyde-3-phosphate dehydrogenase [Paenarthrobacter sp. SD-1]NKR10527.1 glyceraldehyde-3-phosphate dehydrogenase [Arthrobacter sp. M5]NKR18287.1 glyceraldehyde-3-phosphate dehydrogenase [Arthrobacter sp. M6]OEH58303.1 glyceraldehyde-3-phosphate dehydrogenase [Arthrobacter sp. D4]OEH61474.1 glyceraldehyde-3-phosphate de